MEWLNLDTAEKMLIVGAIVALLLAGAAPTTLPFGISLTWTTGGRRTLAAAGLLFLIMSFPPVRDIRFTSDAGAEAVSQKFESFIVKKVKGTLMPLVGEARNAAWGASTNTSDASGCVTAAITAMKRIEDISTGLNALVLETNHLDELPQGSQPQPQ
ncbi:hypothetical protein E5S70_30955 [Ensifer adhaerens]|uniref:hypothetical protein n=1 Tax=Ensifer canadensis TaxID=555315 RepID=UPI00149078BE|nr:hypothetical protein [Ensifer canadensis]NOV20421.1 hypothetical protein [Ensifer canadensis]